MSVSGSTDFVNASGDEPRSKAITRKALVEAAFAVLLILGQLSVTYIAAYALFFLLKGFPGFPVILSLPVFLRLAGILVFAAGFGFAIDTFRFRHPWDMLVSTSVTLLRLFRRRGSEATSKRTEPFRAVGPYRYVRNPLYLGAVLITLGSGLFLSSIFLLIWVIPIVLWFWFVVIPYEERELVELFGEQYTAYRKQVPRLFPNGRKYR